MKVSHYDVFNKMVGELAGKNSLGKVAQYALKIIVLYSSNFQKQYGALFGHREIDVYKWLRASVEKGKYDYDKLKFLFLYLEFKFLRKFVDRCGGVVAGLSAFRQTLRFGKTPFRVIELRDEVIGLVKSKNYTRILHDDFVTLVIDTGYGVVDEIGLLFRFGFFNAKRTPNFKRLIDRADEIIWYIDIIYQLKIQYQKLWKLEKHRETVLGSGKPAELEQADFEIQVVQLGINKSWCDFVFDSIDVWKLDISKYIYLGSALASGCFNSAKAYKNARRTLERNG